MTFNYRILSVMALLSSSIVFSMENTGALSLLTKEREIIFQSIVKNNKKFESAVPKIKALAQDDQEWKQILDCELCAAKLIDYVEESNPYKGLVAALLGTPGAIKWGKKYVTAHPNAKLTLRIVLADMAKYKENECQWPQQDLEVAKAILDMGVEVMTTDKDRREYSFPKDDPAVIDGVIRYGHMATLYAFQRNKIEFIQLLLDANKM